MKRLHLYEKLKYYDFELGGSSGTIPATLRRKMRPHSISRSPNFVGRLIVWSVMLMQMQMLMPLPLYLCLVISRAEKSVRNICNFCLLLLN